MFWFILLLIIGAIGLVLFSFAKTSKDPGGARVVGLIAIAIALMILGFDATTTVSARTVGVETSFGKPVAALPNGFHVVRPWASIDDSWDGTVQTVQYQATVRLANGTTATADVSVQWQIDTGQQFLTLWRQYRTFSNIENNVLKRQTNNALNQVFETFNPLTTLDANGTQTVQVSSFAPQVESKLAEVMPAGLTVKNVTIPLITYDKQVQDQINSIIAAAAATRVATQQVQTAKQQETANNALAAGNTTPGVLYQQCLSITQAALKAGETLPPGWNCGAPGASVVIPTK